VLALASRFGPGDRIAMARPGYVAYRNTVRALNMTPVEIACGPSDHYQLTASALAAVDPVPAGVIVASPANPTGSVIAPDEMAAIAQVCRTRNIQILSDEIYHGLSYVGPQPSMLSFAPDSMVINSFSKYFNMTGWRLGWMVVPDAMVPVVERLAQNLFICASTVSQQAALACFEAESIAEYERRRAEFKARRDYFVPALNALGLNVPVMPDGAFYAWADCTAAAKKLGVNGSWDFTFEVMNKANLAIAPGRDFGQADTSRFVRFSTARSLPELQAAIGRLQTLLG
jgi:aspartate/methionine/tyrosine aminotransferase